MNLIKFDIVKVSLINNMNKRGPKMDPSSTSHVTGRIFDVNLSNETYCLRVFRLYENHQEEMPLIPQNAGCSP